MMMEMETTMEDITTTMTMEMVTTTMEGTIMMMVNVDG